MKLGSQTGSLVNHMYSRMTKGAPEPEIGMWATILMWTDRSAGTVVAWDAKTKIVSVQGDNAKRTDKGGMSESQNYEYSPNPNAGISQFRLDKKGRWRQLRWNSETNKFNMMKSGNGLILGKRDAYHDYSF